MKVHFRDTKPANASAETLFKVIADYYSYPRFNRAVVEMAVVEASENGVEFKPFIQEAERRAAVRNSPDAKARPA